MAKNKFQIPDYIVALLCDGYVLEKRESMNMKTPGNSYSLVKGNDTKHLNGIVGRQIAAHKDMKASPRQHRGLFQTTTFKYVGLPPAPLYESSLKAEQTAHVQQLVEAINLLKQAAKWLSAASEKNVRLSADIHTRIELQTAHQDLMWIRLTEEIIPLALAATQTQTAGDAKAIVAIGQIKLMVTISL